MLTYAADLKPRQTGRADWNGSGKNWKLRKWKKSLTT
nr:MAG TPA: hypothetical protein [Caudoviricetes sp.]